jgi:hypothetical protein
MATRSATARSSAVVARRTDTSGGGACDERPSLRTTKAGCPARTHPRPASDGVGHDDSNVKGRSRPPATKRSIWSRRGSSGAVSGRNRSAWL